MSSWERDPATGNLTPIGGYVPFTHVGQIIESTTLDTEAKMQQVYGSHTRWISHSGYILRGATSGVTDNDNTNSGSGFGGSDTHELTISEMPSHTHTQNSHNHSQNAHSHTLRARLLNGAGGTTSYGHPYGVNQVGYEGEFAGNKSPMGAGNQPASVLNATATNIAQTATNQNTGGGTANVKGAAHSVTQRYKNIYIWERVS